MGARLEGVSTTRAENAVFRGSTRLSGESLFGSSVASVVAAR